MSFRLLWPAMSFSLVPLLLTMANHHEHLQTVPAGAPRVWLCTRHGHTWDCPGDQPARFPPGLQRWPRGRVRMLVELHGFPCMFGLLLWTWLPWKQSQCASSSLLPLQKIQAGNRACSTILLKRGETLFIWTNMYNRVWTLESIQWSTKCKFH